MHVFSVSAMGVILLELLFSTESELDRGMKAGCGFAQGLPWSCCLVGLPYLGQGCEKAWIQKARKRVLNSHVCLTARIDQELC